MVHPVKMGKKTRMSYSRIDEVLEMPNLRGTEAIISVVSGRRSQGSV